MTGRGGVELHARALFGGDIVVKRGDGTGERGEVQLLQSACVADLGADGGNVHQRIDQLAEL